MAKYTEMVLFDQYNDNTRESIQVREDFDGLNLVAILMRDCDGKINTQMILTIEQAEFLLRTIPKVIETLRENEQEV